MPCAHYTPLALLFVLAGCADQASHGEACLPGDFIARGDDGGEELYRCSPDGAAYEPYDGPDPNLVPDANSCSAAQGAKLAFMCPGCTTDADCAEGLVCFDFPNKGGFLCTRTCTPATAATDCPAPSEGCGNNGHCKP
jgi:hypothetical protein